MSRDRLPCLGIATALLLIANGRWSVAPAAWIAPLFLQRYIRGAPPGWRTWLSGVVLFIAWLFQFGTMVPLPMVGRAAVGLLYSGFLFLPYWIDRGLNTYVSGFASTLIFPCAVAGIEFAYSTLSPYGSWGATAYSQYGDLPLMQFASVTGIYGIAFLVSWFGSVANWCWERGFTWAGCGRGAATFVLVLTIVYTFGTARLSHSPLNSKRERVVGIAGDDTPVFGSELLASRVFRNQALTAGEWTSIKSGMERSNARLIQKTEGEAAAGARLILWSEEAAPVCKEEEAALLGRLAQVARANQIYLGAGMMVYRRGAAKPLENKMVLFTPEGEIATENWKARLVPGGEKQFTVAREGAMPLAPTSLGSIGSFICFDLDFPGLIQQSGRSHADTIIVPSADWLAIDPWHTQMAVFRAIENGVNLLRVVRSGRSIAVDAFGRTLAETDDITGIDSVLIADLPTRGVTTLYSRIGDAFAWLCLGFVAVVIAMAVILKRKRSSLPLLQWSKDEVTKLP